MLTVGDTDAPNLAGLHHKKRLQDGRASADGPRPDANERRSTAPGGTRQVRYA